MRSILPCAFCLFLALLLAVPLGAHAQQQRSEENASVVVVSPAPSLGLGEVGASLVRGPGPRSYRPAQPSTSLQRAAQQREQEVRTEAFKRGALIGGLAGAAAGALVGAALGGRGGNPRVETALPVAMVGLAVGAPTGVYFSTGGSSQYLWGMAGAAGVVAAGATVYFIEAR